jgi:type I restriction enzyme S subunit
MNNWKEFYFSDFVTINPQVNLSKNNNYSFIEMKDLNSHSKYCHPSTARLLSAGSRFEEGDTLFARITPCLENGKICQAKNLINKVGFGSTEFLVFRGKNNISDTDFIFYLARFDDVRSFAESHMEGTSGRQRVPKECFNKLKLYLPPLSEQKAIASVLSCLETLRYQNLRNLKKYQVVTVP